MKTSVKILIGVAIVAIVYFIYKKRKATENPVGKNTGKKVYAKNIFGVNVFSNVGGDLVAPQLIKTIDAGEGDFLGFYDGELIDSAGNTWYHIKEGTNKPIGYVQASEVTLK